VFDEELEGTTGTFVWPSAAVAIEASSRHRDNRSFTSGSPLVGADAQKANRGLKFPRFAHPLFTLI
jgi:hypothetical protein